MATDRPSTCPAHSLYHGFHPLCVITDNAVFSDLLDIFAYGKFDMFVGHELDMPNSLALSVTDKARLRGRQPPNECKRLYGAMQELLVVTRFLALDMFCHPKNEI